MSEKEIGNVNALNATLRHLGGLQKTTISDIQSINQSNRSTMKNNCKLVVALTASLSAFGSTFASAQILYSASFNFPGGTGSTISESLNTAYGTTSANDLTNGFAAFTGSTATDVSSGLTVDIADRQSPNGPASGPNQYGILVANGGLSSFIAASTPTGLSIGTGTTALTFNWYQGDAQTSDTARLAIDVGGTWYASVSTFGTGPQGAGAFAANPSATAEAKTLTFSTATWDALTFNPGSALSLGGLVAAPSGNIIGIGFFDGSTLAGNERFDTLTINGTVVSVPEPSTYALLLSGVIGLVFLARRRNHKLA